MLARWSLNLLGPAVVVIIGGIYLMATAQRDDQTALGFYIIALPIVAYGALGAFVFLRGTVRWVERVATTRRIHHTGMPPPIETRIPCPDCAEMIMRAAKKCRFCGARIGH